MSIKDKQMPGQGPATSASIRESAAKAARKQARLSEALRANLAKRKDQAQARARAAGEDSEDRRATNPPQSAPQNPGGPPRPQSAPQTPVKPPRPA